MSTIYFRPIYMALPHHQPSQQVWVTAVKVQIYTHRFSASGWVLTSMGISIQNQQVQNKPTAVKNDIIIQLPDTHSTNAHCPDRTHNGLSDPSK